MQPATPTHLIMGLLGVGKTTAIRHLLSRKPAGEHWAVLVNEFGEIGIDGALLQQEGVRVKEVPGGCMCCVAGLPMQIGLNRLLGRDRPDRLLIEPTGLGHPAQILAVLEGEVYRQALTLATSLCLVDPRRLQDPRVLNNAHFIDQVAAADIVVANKIDLCDRKTLNHYRSWAQTLCPPKAQLVEVSEGRIDPALLASEPTHAERPLHYPQAHYPQAHGRHSHGSALAPASAFAGASHEGWYQAGNRGNGHFSVGWRIAPEYRFSREAVLEFCHTPGWIRCKGVLLTDEGWLAINVADGLATTRTQSAVADSRLEIITDKALDARALDAALAACLASAVRMPPGGYP